MPTLNWLTKEEDLKIAANTPYRLLVEEEKYSSPLLDNEKIDLIGYWLLSIRI